MAEDAKPWDAVYDQIKAYRDPIFAPLPPVTDADLDEAESQLGSPLPRSYRAFMTRFGPESSHTGDRRIVSGVTCVQ